MMSCSPELTVYDFFHSYIFSRAEACMHLSEQDQRIVKIAKNTLSIITFGILPNFCKRWWGGDSGNYTIQVANLARRLKDCDYFNLPTFKEDATQIKESKNKRACVNPKFATFLHDYANRLKNPSEPLKSE